MKILGREPTLWLQVISGTLALVVTFGWDGLSAILGAVNAATVRPVAPAAFTAVVTTGAALLTTYGLELGQETIGAVQVLVISVLALLTRTQVTPAADPRPTAPDAGPVV